MQEGKPEHGKITDIYWVPAIIVNLTCTLFIYLFFAFDVSSGKQWLSSSFAHTKFRAHRSSEFYLNSQ